MDEYGKVLDLFQKRGYNEVDTARVYVGGKQEAFTREVGWKERGLTLATKVKYPANPGDNVADKVTESVELSLKELGTDCVDLLYLHAAVSLFHVLIHATILWGDVREGVRIALVARLTWDVHRIAPRPSQRPSRRSTSCTRPASSSGWGSATSLRSRWPRYA